MFVEFELPLAQLFDEPDHQRMNLELQHERERSIRELSSIGSRTADRRTRAVAVGSRAVLVKS
ncbi:hypothetical protein F2Q70_00032183 [Brassica cretica]|uniref:Uncharacterized protein n=1 Tax=Brassica cretica TaxID=69181 RepID=A0A8S9FBN2_BRACR|nr:hypothetical protein F2Q70_00032183 [Brassica cretica]